MSALFPFPKSGKRTLPGKGSRDQGIDGEECLPSIPQSLPSFIPREFLGWGVDSLRGRMSRRLVVYRQTTTANGIASNPIPLPVPSTISKDLSIFSPSGFYCSVVFAFALSEVVYIKRQQTTGNFAFMHSSHCVLFLRTRDKKGP
ncbi:hypothetical protein TNCV_3691141 [Trichonephila clavipes]|nr:hypothetical protein TNCV_3691141 [Trichonephila clavipes]